MKLRAGNLEQSLVDVKKAMELDSTSSSLYRFVIPAMVPKPDI